MDFDHPPPDPVAQLRAWLEEAEARSGLPNANAMTLATIDPDGLPSARIVLLKAITDRGVIFFSNRESGKGRALAAHPQAALVLHWDPLQRQVCMMGDVSPTDDETSDAYFASRARDSRIGAWASRQSRPLWSRADLEHRVAEVQRRFGDGPVPRPPNWGGYLVTLRSIEFWSGRPNRLHDRVRYTLDESAEWRAQRLYP